MFKKLRVNLTEKRKELQAAGKVPINVIRMACKTL